MNPALKRILLSRVEYPLDIISNSVLSLGTTRLSRTHTSPLARIHESAASAEADINSDQNGKLSGSQWGSLVGTSGLNPNNLVSNPDFASGTTGWTFGSWWGVVDGKATRSGAVSSTNINQSMTIISGHKYYIRFEASGTPQILISPFEGSYTLRSVGTNSIIFTASGNATSYAMFGYNTVSMTLDNIIVVDLTDKHPEKTATMTDAQLKTWADANISFYSNANAYGSVVYDQSGSEVVNYCPTDEASWEQGTIRAVDGTTEDSLNRIRTKNMIEVEPNTSYTFGSTQGYLSFTFQYTSDDVFITSSDTWKNVPYTLTTSATTAKLKIIFKISDVVEILPSVILSIKPTSVLGSDAGLQLRAKQTTAASQPMAVMSGNLLDGFKFDATDDSLVVAKTPVINDITNLSVMWVGKFNGAGGGNAGRIFDKYSPGLGRYMWIDTVNMCINLRQYFAAASYISWSTPNSSLVYNKNYVIVLIYDNSAKTNDPIMYINGVPQALTKTDSSSSGNPASDAVQDLYIGNRSAGDRGLNGTMKDFIMANGLWTPNTVSRLTQNAFRRHGFTA